MNITKNMDIILAFAVPFAFVASMASAAVPGSHAVVASAVEVKVDNTAAMPVVTITGKRLSAAEKASLQD